MTQPETPAPPQDDPWPENRFGKRLPLRLRRRTYQHPGWHKLAGGKGERKDPAPPADTGLSERQLAELNEKFREQLQRVQAEFENYRRRTRKEMEEIRQTAGASVLEGLLPVVDNFGRALKAPAASLESFSEGIRMIQGHFMNLLRDAGLERVDSDGKMFDPNLHEAVAVDNTGAHPDNTVVETLQDGYTVRGKLIRPAIVKVARQG